LLAHDGFHDAGITLSVSRASRIRARNQRFLVGWPLWPATIRRCGAEMTPNFQTSAKTVNS
jgi:hypothetical protein